MLAGNYLILERKKKLFSIVIKYEAINKAFFVCFHCFSVIGAVVIAIGFYTVLWAQSKEENAKGLQVDRLSSPSAQASPLLETVPRK